MIPSAHRYHVTDTYAAAALRRDGIGWDHEGSSLMLAEPGRAGIVARLSGKSKRRMRMETLSSNASYGGVQHVIKHASTACNCDMTFGLFLPAEAEEPAAGRASGELEAINTT